MNVIGYVRCIYDNLGDVALDLSLRRMLGKIVKFIPYDRFSRSILTYRLFRGRVPFDSYVLGGGTLIFSHSAWFEDILSLYGLGVSPLATLGSGVMNPSFFKQKKWIIDFWVNEVLSNMRVVGVRGEDSRKVLADYGINSIVVGDPALWFVNNREKFARKKFKRILGINWGISGYSYLGNGYEKSISILEEILVNLWNEYDEVIFYAVCAKDREVFQKLDAFIRRRIKFRLILDPYRFCFDVSGCTNFIGMKLHSVVLSLLVSVPSLMISYQPKCDEVMEELGLSDYSCRVNEVSVKWIRMALEKIESISIEEKIKLYKKEKWEVLQGKVIPVLAGRF